MLLRLFAPQIEDTKLRIMPFDEILAATASGAVDAGLIIHESRFTYKEHGLECAQDLGEWWETTFDQPIPLGGIVVHRRVPLETRREIERALAESVRAARRDPKATRDYVNQYAQEMDPAVQKQHIELYVNQFSESLGEAGVDAVRAFFRAR